MSTDISEKNYAIQPELLDELEQMYNTHIGTYHHLQRDLLMHDGDDLRMKLAVAHGIGLALQHILKSIPQEQRHERTIWWGIFGPNPGRDRSGSSREKTAGHSVGTEPGGKSFIS